MAQDQHNHLSVPPGPPDEEWPQPVQDITHAAAARTRAVAQADSNSRRQSTTESSNLDVTRGVDAIFGRRWILAAQRAGRGFDMGGFPSAAGTSIINNDAMDRTSPRSNTQDPPWASSFSSHFSPITWASPSFPTISGVPAQASSSRIRTGAPTDARARPNITDSPCATGGIGDTPSAVGQVGRNNDPTTLDLNASRRASSPQALLQYRNDATARASTNGGHGNTVAPAGQLVGGNNTPTILDHATSRRPSTALVYSGNDWDSTSMTLVSGNISTSLWRITAGTAVSSADSNDDTIQSTSGNTGVSPNYQGDPSLQENVSAQISADESTSLYIRGLGPSTTVSDVLAVIRNTGKVYSLFINPPSDNHIGSAAKLCFFTRAAAETFFNATRLGFWVQGYCAEVIWNRFLVPEHHPPSNWPDACRVVIVRGRNRHVSLAKVLNIIRQRIRFFDLDREIERPDAPFPGYTEVELHFGSFGAQAHSAFVVLSRILVQRGVQVTYGTDPCV